MTIGFLTTNRVNQIGEAIARRTRIPLEYELLALDARGRIWGMFMKNVVTKIGRSCYTHSELDILADKDLNRR